MPGDKHVNISGQTSPCCVPTTCNSQVSRLTILKLSDFRSNIDGNSDLIYSRSRTPVRTPRSRARARHRARWWSHIDLVSFINGEPFYYRSSYLTQSTSLYFQRGGPVWPGTRPVQLAQQTCQSDWQLQVLARTSGPSPSPVMVMLHHHHHQRAPLTPTNDQERSAGSSSRGKSVSWTFYSAALAHGAVSNYIFEILVVFLTLSFLVF